MSDQFYPHQQPEETAAAEQAEREAVCADNQAARHELAGECSETSNETPEGRLRWFCVQEGMSLQDVDTEELLQDPYLARAFLDPLPMKKRYRTQCINSLREKLGLSPDLTEEASADHLAEERAELVAQQEAQTTVETRVADKQAGLRDIETSVAQKKEVLETSNVENVARQERNTEQAETIDAYAAVVSETIKSLPAGNLTHYRTETNRLLAEQFQGEELVKVTNLAKAEFAKHEQNLTAMQAVFTPDEVQTIFGGDMAKTITLNLASQANSEIYRDIFAKVDAGIADDDRRKEVRAQLEAQLGIKPHPIEVDSGGDVNEVFNRGYGTETYIDENGEVQERNIPLGPGFEVEYRGGHRLGVDKFGSKYATIQNDAGMFKVILPDNPTDADIGRYIRTAQMRGQFHHMNAAQAFYPGVRDFELSGGTMILRQPQDFVVTDNLERIMIGREGLKGNDIFTEDELKQIPYLLQFHAGKADYMMGDVNPEQMQADLKAQGVMNKNNTINWEKFEALVSANRGRYTTQQNYVQHKPSEES